MDEIEGGYFKGANSIFEISLNPFQIVVYLYITRCGNNSKAYPRYETIAKKCGMSERKAKEVVKGLVELGLLEKTVRIGSSGNQSNLYKVVNPRDAGYAPHHAGDALGGELDALPGAGGAHNKELVLKELDYKKLDYKNTYIELEFDGNVYLTLYNDYFKKKFNKDHMAVKEDQYEDIIGNIELLEINDITPGAFSEAVEEHFNKLAEGNNGNILGFIPAFPRYFELLALGQDYNWRKQQREEKRIHQQRVVEGKSKWPE